MNITTKEDYLNALQKETASLNEADRIDALQYYREFFEDAGPENEGKVIADLGSPKKLASQLKAQSAVKEAKSDPKNGKKSLRAVWLAVLSLFAVPIGIPLAAALAVVILSMILVLFLLIFCFYLVSVLFGLMTVVCLVVSVFALFQNFSVFVILFGSIFAFAGLTGLCIIPTHRFSRWSIQKLTELANRIIHPKKRSPLPN